jgi:transposase
VLKAGEPMTNWALSARERRQLEALVDQTHDARVLRRAYSLLWLDKGEPVADIAAHWQVNRKSVYNWHAHFVKRQGLAIELRLADAERSGRPCTAQGVIEPLIEAVMDTPPSTFGYHATVWTAALLVRYLQEMHQLTVSLQSVRLALARLRRHWKRARHQLALRPATWRQSKGG